MNFSFLKNIEIRRHLTICTVVIFASVVGMGSCQTDFGPDALVPDPSFVDFKSVQLDSCTHAPIYFLNHKNFTLRLRATISNREFSFRDTTNLKDSLPMAMSTAISVYFCPKVAGLFRDTVHLIGSDGVTYASVPLSGIGVP